MSRAWMFFDRSAGSLSFGGGATTVWVVDTDGSWNLGDYITMDRNGIDIGPGLVELGQNGVRVEVSTSESNTRSFQLVDSSNNVIGIVSGLKAAGYSQASLRAFAIGGNPAYLYLAAPTRVSISGQDATFSVGDGGDVAISGLGTFYVAGMNLSTDEDIYCTGQISTDGGTTQWDLGGYTAGAVTPDGYITVVINGTTYRLAADQV